MKNLLVRQVDLLLSKIKSLPENEKELAFSKIRERLSSDGAQSQDFVVGDQNGLVAVVDNTQKNKGRKRKKLVSSNSSAGGTNSYKKKI